MNTQQSGKGAAFIQVDPLAPMGFLTGTGVTGVTPPKRAREPSYLPDLLAGEFKADDLIAGDKPLWSANFVRPLVDTYNYLLEHDCDFNMQINLLCAGERPVISNYEIAAILIRSAFSAADVNAMVVLAPGENARVDTTGTATALIGAWLKKLQGARQNINPAQDVNDIAFLPAQCYSKCSIYRGIGQVGYAVLDTDYVGVYGDTVLKTIDYGGQWLPTTYSPFLTLGRNAEAVIVVPLSGTEHRVIVAGGPMGGVWPEIGYSDGTRDTAGNAPWTNVNPAGIGHGGIGINAMARDSLGNIYAAADAGRIYMSQTQAVSWSVAENGVETNQNLNDIAFYGTRGYAVGDSNIVLLKLADATDWNAIDGPKVGANLLSVETNYLGYVFVGTNGGELYRSYDGGLTWGRIAANITAAGSIDRIDKDPYTEYGMYLLYNNTTPFGTVYRSIDGGVTFNPENMTTLANNGLYALAVCDINTLTFGGDITGTTGFIGKMQPRG